MQTRAFDVVFQWKYHYWWWCCFQLLGHESILICWNTFSAPSSVRISLPHKWAKNHQMDFGFCQHSLKCAQIRVLAAAAHIMSNKSYLCRWFICNCLLISTAATHLHALWMRWCKIYVQRTHHTVHKIGWCFAVYGAIYIFIHVRRYVSVLCTQTSHFDIDIYNYPGVITVCPNALSTIIIILCTIRSDESIKPFNP